MSVLLLSRLYSGLHIPKKKGKNTNNTQQQPQKLAVAWICDAASIYFGAVRSYGIIYVVVKMFLSPFYVHESKLSPADVQNGRIN